MFIYIFIFSICICVLLCILLYVIDIILILNYYTTYLIQPVYYCGVDPHSRHYLDDSTRASAAVEQVHHTGTHIDTVYILILV